MKMQLLVALSDKTKIADFWWKKCWCKQNSREHVTDFRKATGGFLYLPLSLSNSETEQPKYG